MMLKTKYRRQLRNFWHIYRSSKMGIFGAATLSIFLVMAIFAPWIAPYDPRDISSIRAGKPFSKPQWVRVFDSSISEDDVYGLLGTDELGRDLWSQIVYGARTSLVIGLSAALVSLIIGVLVGLTSGYFGGVVDEVLMRATDIMLILPFLPLVIVLAAILGPRLENLIMIIGLTGWANTARVIRSQVLSLKERTFVEAGIATGASDAHIITHYILLNVLPLVYVNAALGVSGAILSEAWLSFLGLGDPFHISWGMILFYANEYQALTLLAWWYFVPPGLCILLVVLSFIFIGHTLDEVLNPRLRRR